MKAPRKRLHHPPQKKRTRPQKERKNSQLKQQKDYNAATPGLIGVFAKPPLPNQVKTRLTPAYTPEQAAELAKAFLLDTWSALARVATRKVLVVTAPIPDLIGPHEVWLQGPGDLGVKLERMLRRGLDEGCDWSVAVGTDSPGLPPRYYDAAADQLRHHDAVLGPCEDGGFYLIGLRRCPTGLLADLPWSSEETFAETHARLVASGLSVGLLPEWFDVDRPDDLDRLHQLLRAGDISAPHTLRALEALS